MNKVKFVLVVDDDQINNFVCSRMIKLSGISDHIECVLGGQEALEVIKNAAAKEKQLPDLLFLDINMPGMSGWDFLDQYRNLPPEIKTGTRIFMLSSSLYKDDIDKSSQYKEVTEYVIKPLSIEALREIERKYF
ncbi:MAG: response regulator [Chitinophagaceae bacterium]|jgi:CheY-like chemotaxis protein|nr:response regulator [Chitinophagaceae bacterium]